uniref:ShKT domain-containing protein n=1 Tax=Ciona savignyi TaxID=51511 RepID=H2Z4W2_CIOSA
MQVKCRKSCGLCTKCGSSAPVVQPQPASGASGVSGSALRPPSGSLSSLLRPPSVPGLSNLFPQGFPFPRTTTTQSPTTTTNRRTTTTQRLTTTTSPVTTTTPISTTPPPVNPVPTTSSDGTCTLQMGRTVDEQCLYTHNYYRCLHGVPPLRLSSELKSSAQYYANSMAADGKLGYHSLKPSVIGIERAATVGENLAWRMQPNNRYNIEQAAADWYAEGLYYDYNQPESSTKEHFTQMIWKDTTEVGCAVSQIGAQIYAVAQYKLAGNIPGLYADNVKPTTARVCQAHCSMGRCQGHDGMSSTCLCQTRRMALPSCTGNCVVYCPKPESHAGYWETRCAGKRMCRCDGYRRGGRHPGAVCN